MRQMLNKLWNDDGGSALLTSELLVIFTVLVLGVITGLAAMRQAVVTELTESAQALLALNQSYSFSGQANCESSTGGSSASDATNSIGESSAAASTATISQAPCN
jgi:hypothetical protein